MSVHCDIWHYYYIHVYSLILMCIRELAPPPFAYIARDGKEPSLLGFGSVRVLTKARVRFGSSSSQVQKIWVRFGFGSYILSFEFGSVRFGCLTVFAARCYA